MTHPDKLSDTPRETQDVHPMVSPSTISDSTIYITTSAVNRLRVLKEAEAKKKEGAAENILRLTVSSGGCYGFQYKFDFVATPLDDDLCFTYEDITLATDTVSYDLIQNIILDYAQELIGAAFTLRNPNSEASCGCGNSFSL